jgi:hypothetical protein
MKKLLLLITILPLGLLSQENFQWDIRDSIELSKDDIYAITKQFIAETWNNPESVIKNDDKETGIILLRGIRTDEYFYCLNFHEFTFEYQVKFQMKEGQYRFVIENVWCKSHTCSNPRWLLHPILHVSDQYSGKETAGGMKAELYLALMYNLKSELQSLADRYVQFMAENPVSDDW